MNSTAEMIKIKLKDESGWIRNVDFGQAFFTTYEHPHSKPWEIKILTNDNITGSVEVEYLIKGHKTYNNLILRMISANYNYLTDKPNEYILR